MILPQQRKYYRWVVLPKITAHFNRSKKKWYLIKVWKPDYTHNWMKRYYFSDKSTTIFEEEEFEEIMRKIRVDFSKYVWIPTPWEDENPPIF